MNCHLGILVTHPIQYLTPWFRYLANRLDVEVFYAHQQNAVDHADAGFGVEFEWDLPILEGYQYRWLTNVARKPGVQNFKGIAAAGQAILHCDNGGIVDRAKAFCAFNILDRQA